MNYELRCRECGKSWGNQPKSICEDCFSPLEVIYDYSALRCLSRQIIGQRPANMWRYAELLPLPNNFHPSLPVGFTPLVSAPRLASELGAKRHLSRPKQWLSLKMRKMSAFGAFGVSSRSGGRLTQRHTPCDFV